MNTYADPTLENKSKAAANRSLQRAENSESADPLQKLANNSQQVRQLKGYQEMANSSSAGVIQMIRPEGEGYYEIQGKGRLWYKGEPEVEGYYNFYVNPQKKMSQKIKEEAILSKVKEEKEEGEKLGATPIPPLSTIPSLPTSSSVGFSGRDEIHTFEKVPVTGESDSLLSGKFPEQPGDFNVEYQTRVKDGNKYYKRINNLILRAREYMKTLPEGYVGLWRFHMSAEEYQSHAYQEASKKQEVVPKGVLIDAITNMEVLASHMYESSKKNTSPGVSFSRSIDSLIDASFHTGADSVLRAVIFGGQQVAPAKFLSFVAIPRKELVFPEDVPVPKEAQNRDRKGEARARSLKELEALHIPLPETGGRTHNPLFTVENPFPEQQPLSGLGSLSQLGLRSGLGPIPGQESLSPQGSLPGPGVLSGLGPLPQLNLLPQHGPLPQQGPQTADFTKLKTLDLRGFNMHWTDTRTLIEAIEKGQLPNLKKLVVRAGSITPDLRGRALARVDEVEVIT